MKTKNNYISIQNRYNDPVRKIYFDINQLPIREYKGKWYFLVGSKLYWTNYYGFKN